MDGRGQGSGIFRIQGFHNGVAYQNGIGTGFDTGGKGNQITAFQVRETAAVNGNAGMGIGIVAVAGKMLQAASRLRDRKSTRLNSSH